MNTFDSDPSNSTSPESARLDAHPILKNWLEINQLQPDRAKAHATEGVTGFEESKMIAEIITPTDRIAVIRTQFSSDLPASIMIVGPQKNPAMDTALFLDPGEIADLSDTDKKGKCIIELDKTGEHLFVYADDPDPAYEIRTKMLEAYDAPSFEESYDDPDLPYTISRT